ncbi:MAG: hypothetical protein EDR02_18610 [Actinobacteria bacterium]|nr:MAG: hypothetical protein EDR02_18610 [Actinomycetota bacterium]
MPVEAEVLEGDHHLGPGVVMAVRPDDGVASAGGCFGLDMIAQPPDVEVDAEVPLLVEPHDEAVLLPRRWCIHWSGVA